MAKKRKAKRSAKRKGHSIVVTTSSRVVKTTRMNPGKADKLLLLITKKWPEFRTDKPIGSGEFTEWMTERFTYADNRRSTSGKIILREFPGLRNGSDVNGNDLIDFVGELLTRSNPKPLSREDARRLFERANKARELASAPTEAQRRARNEATLKRMRKNPDAKDNWFAQFWREMEKLVPNEDFRLTSYSDQGMWANAHMFHGMGQSPAEAAKSTLKQLPRLMKKTRKNPGDLLFGSKRLATAMSYWHGGMSDPVYGVSSMWPEHGVTRDRVEDALANMESMLARFNTPEGRARGGWTAKDGRQLRSIVAGLKKVLGTKTNPVRTLVVPRKMWSRLQARDRRTKNGHRYVRCKTRRARRAFWLPCTIR